MQLMLNVGIGHSQNVTRMHSFESHFAIAYHVLICNKLTYRTTFLKVSNHEYKSNEELAQNVTPQ